MTALWLFSLAVLVALADWYAVDKNITWLRYSSKPLVIILLGTWLLLQPISFSILFWFFLALVFSLIGDIWLLAPSRFFMAGLASFLLAHVCYIIGFNQHQLPPFTWPVVQLVSFFIFLGVFIYPLLYQKHQKEIRYAQAAGCDLDLLYHPVLDGDQCSIHLVPA